MHIYYPHKLANCPLQYHQKMSCAEERGSYHIISSKKKIENRRPVMRVCITCRYNDTKFLNIIQNKSIHNSISHTPFPPNPSNLHNLFTLSPTLPLPSHPSPTQPFQIPTSHPLQPHPTIPPILSPTHPSQTRTRSLAPREKKRRSHTFFYIIWTAAVSVNDNTYHAS